jgi:ABC-type polysaccharide/polyol phosphate export permease
MKDMNAAARRFTWYYARSQLRLKYRYTLLGFLWNFLEPALYLIVLSLIFSVVNRMDIADYAVFLFAGLVPWRYFENVVNTCMDSIVHGDWALKKLYISPLSFPLTRWVVASFDFLCSLVVVFAVFAVIKQEWTIHLVILPLAVIPWSLLGFGVGLICAVLSTFFRDVRPIVLMLLMRAFFASPILFRADLFPDGSLQSLLIRWHPITYFAALFQAPLYHSEWPGAVDWLLASAMSVSLLVVGCLLITRFRGRFYFYV